MYTLELSIAENNIFPGEITIPGTSDKPRFYYRFLASTILDQNQSAFMGVSLHF